MEPHYPPVAPAPLCPAELQLIGLLASIALEQTVKNMQASGLDQFPYDDIEVPREGSHLHPLQH
jgi:hypothetical protein